MTCLLYQHEVLSSTSSTRRSVFKWVQGCGGMAVCISIPEPGGEQEDRLPWALQPISQDKSASLRFSERRRLREIRCRGMEGNAQSIPLVSTCLHTQVHTQERQREREGGRGGEREEQRQTEALLSARFNITSHKGNSSQNHNEMLLHSYWHGYH